MKDMDCMKMLISPYDYLSLGELYVNTRAILEHYHHPSGRPNHFRYGKMVVRNGWYVWRVKFPNPTLKAKLKWHAITILLTVIRASNVVNKNKRKEAFTEALGRIEGWFSIFVKKTNIVRFAIFSHVEHRYEDHKYYGYGPYIKEMNIWLKYVDQVDIIAPLKNQKPNIIDLNYEHSKINFSKIPSFNFTNKVAILNSFFVIPFVLLKIFMTMSKADHIHLRCPGNVGLLACLVQILFPWKKKTAKYAGNWDPKSKQPMSYRLQKWILSNTFLTRNIQVLVYGEWPNQTKNIKPFFTASYNRNEIKERVSNEESFKQYSEPSMCFKFLYVGTLSPGKQPLYAIKLVEELVKKGKRITLDVFGDGILKSDLQDYISNNKLESIVTLHGNQINNMIKRAYQVSQFLILPSKSEGWPKVVAEGHVLGLCTALN